MPECCNTSGSAPVAKMDRTTGIKLRGSGMTVRRGSASRTTALWGKINTTQPLRAYTQCGILNFWLAIHFVYFNYETIYNTTSFIIFYIEINGVSRTRNLTNPSKKIAMDPGISGKQNGTHYTCKMHASKSISKIYNGDLLGGHDDGGIGLEADEDPRRDLCPLPQPRVVEESEALRGKI